MELTKSEGMIPMTNLRKIRKQERLTMQALADLSGVSESAIGMYETGKRKPSFEVLLRLSEALGCTVDELVKEREDKTEEEELEIGNIKVRALHHNHGVIRILQVGNPSTWNEMPNHT